MNNTNDLQLTRNDAVIESVDLLHEGWGRYLLLQIRGGGRGLRVMQLDDHGDAAAVLPYDPDRGVMILVRQLRPGPLFAAAPNPVLEIPAGRIESLDAADCAHREVLEETGILLRDLEAIGSYWVSPATTTERLHLYLGRYSLTDRIGPGGGLEEEGEDIEVVELPLSTVAEMCRSGELDDLKSVMAVQSLWIAYPDLFGSSE